MFREAFDIRRILSQLEIEAGVKITPEDTLIIFDEVQEIPRALKSLKYFQENAPQYHIMAAGSLLGIALHEGTSFPVGKVDFCDMYPLTFTEFLLANEQDGLVGLLGAMAKLNARTMLDGDSFFEEFKGALTEQYVLQQLKTVKQSDIYYWAAENARAEVDFVVQLEDRIIPIEVKAAENLQAKSLKEFVQKYDNRNAVRTSMADFRVQDWMVNMPLYCIGTLQKYFVSLL